MKTYSFSTQRIKGGIAYHINFKPMSEHFKFWKTQTAAIINVKGGAFKHLNGMTFPIVAVNYAPGNKRVQVSLEITKGISTDFGNNELLAVENVNA